MYAHSGNLVAPILVAVILASAGVTQAAPIVDSEFNSDIQQHRVWAVRDRVLQGAENPSVPESVILQLYGQSTTLDQVPPPVDHTTGLDEPALAATLSEPAPFALLVAALGGLFLRRRK